MKSDLDTLTDQSLFARVLWGEARNQPKEGRQAIANVVMNRVNKPRWWGKNVRQVLTKPYQFSCLLISDPNRAKLMAVTQDDPIYRECYALAGMAISGALADLTSGSDSYQVVGTNAYWSEGLTPVVTIGQHEFFITV